MGAQGLTPTEWVRFHRCQLRQVIGIRYPQKISGNALYISSVDIGRTHLGKWRQTQLSKRADLATRRDPMQGVDKDKKGQLMNDIK